MTLYKNVIIIIIILR